MSELSSLALHLYLSRSLSLSFFLLRSRSRLGFLIFTRSVPSSLALPGANSLPEDRAPIPSPLLPSSTALGSIHGIASWFSEGSRLSPTTPDGAPLARSLSRCVFAHWLTHGGYLALRPSPRSFSLPLTRSLTLSFSLSTLRPRLFSSLLFAPLHPSLLHTLCLAARLRSQPATRGPPVTQQ